MKMVPSLFVIYCFIQTLNCIELCSKENPLCFTNEDIPLWEEDIRTNGMRLPNFNTTQIHYTELSMALGNQMYSYLSQYSRAENVDVQYWLLVTPGASLVSDTYIHKKTFF